MIVNFESDGDRVKAAMDSPGSQVAAVVLLVEREDGGKTAMIAENNLTCAQAAFIAIRFAQMSDMLHKHECEAGGERPRVFSLAEAMIEASRREVAIDEEPSGVEH